MENIKADAFDVTCVGNALIEIFITANNTECINKNQVPGSMYLIDEFEADILQERALNKTILCGGSAANTAVGIASFGGKASFIGKVKNDFFGKLFYKEMIKKNVSFLTNLSNSGYGTGKNYIIISSDKKERTMYTYLGAASELNEHDVSTHKIKDSKILFVEGYLWDKNNSKKAALKAIDIACEYGVRVAFTLSDSLCVERHKEEFIDLIYNKVDILFGNKKEALTLFDSIKLKSAIELAQKSCQISIFTLGSKGAMIIDKNNIYRIKPKKVDKIIDTTGAGDAFAAGFLYGLSKGMKPIDCGKMGSIASAENVSHLGSRPKVVLSNLLKETKPNGQKKLNNILNKLETALIKQHRDESIDKTIFNGLDD